jgi:hypothetical protein
MGSNPALIAFAIATLLEIVAYYVPWLDNLLDTIATPAAVVAGVVVTAAVVGDMSPLLKWTLAVIAGGGVAGAVQAATVALRGTSTVTTGGIANPAVSTGELGGSAVVATLAVALPVVAVALVIILGAFLVRLRKWSKRSS